MQKACQCSGVEGNHQFFVGRYDQHVDRVGADQRVGDLQRLLARVGLRDDQFIDIDAQFLGIDRIERMLGPEGGWPAY